MLEAFKAKYLADISQARKCFKINIRDNIKVSPNTTLSVLNAPRNIISSLKYGYETANATEGENEKYHLIFR